MRPHLQLIAAVELHAKLSEYFGTPAATNRFLRTFAGLTMKMPHLDVLEEALAARGVKPVQVPDHESDRPNEVDVHERAAPVV